jgi:hypothetical protein
MNRYRRGLSFIGRGEDRPDRERADSTNTEEVTASSRYAAMTPK